MFKAIDINTRTVVDLDEAIILARCPKCGAWHQVDLWDTIVEQAEKGDFSGIDDLYIYCAECSNPRPYGGQ